MLSHQARRMLPACLFFSATLPALVQANTISYYLDQSNDLPNGTNYLQVTISDSTAVAGDIDFSVAVLTDAFSVSPTSNFGMQSFYFNYADALTVTEDNIYNIDPSSWSISSKKNGENAGGGYFKFEIALSGDGSSRTELLSFSIKDVVGDSVEDYAVSSSFNPESGEFFAAHVAGFDETNGVTSSKFAGSTLAPVPVPAAVWLFGSGLLGLVGVARRKQ